MKLKKPKINNRVAIEKKNHLFKNPKRNIGYIKKINEDIPIKEFW
jgi:hypothetical protein